MFFSSSPLPFAVATILLLIQIPAAFILLSRLLKGPGRRRPIQPQTPIPEQLGTVSVVVPTLNERDRLTPCLGRFKSAKLRSSRNHHRR